MSRIPIDVDTDCGRCAHIRSRDGHPLICCGHGRDPETLRVLAPLAPKVAEWLRSGATTDCPGFVAWAREGA